MAFFKTWATMVSEARRPKPEGQHFQTPAMHTDLSVASRQIAYSWQPCNAHTKNPDVRQTCFTAGGDLCVHLHRRLAVPGDRRVEQGPHLDISGERTIDRLLCAAAMRLATLTLTAPW